MAEHGTGGVDIATFYEVVQLACRYSTAYDTKDWDLLRSCYVPDGRLTMGDTEIVGYETIERGSRSVFERVSTQHMVSNHQVTPAGHDLVHTCYLHAQHWFIEEPDRQFTIGGRYTDEVVATDTGWRFRHRRIDTMWTAGDPSVLAAAGGTS